ncbi:MAG: bifunctional phosphopantothenoylcysteine decarboxylase/phosphopantothenate--cysteine ligase CoaBC [Pseudomonadota bacterium]
MDGNRILLIIGGGIACYKCLELVRRLKERGYGVRTIMTQSAQRFITPLAVSALTNERVFTELFDVDDEREIGHIRLSRQADLVLVAPATANLLARMANGIADDLATATLLASDKPPLIAPAMNPKMWSHPATQRNVAQLIDDGADIIGPDAGEMAEHGEAGVGRLVDPMDLVRAIEDRLTLSGGSQALTEGVLAGRHVVITAGPTHEPIDPVRYIANRSSGKQGFAIARAARDAGARVTLISGPVALTAPTGVAFHSVQTAGEMLSAVREALSGESGPADVGVFAAAVADWRVDTLADQKIKKPETGKPPKLTFVENPDILKTIANDPKLRPGLVVGFAAETGSVVAFAQRKLISKNADWIIANDVSDGTGVMGGDHNTVHVVGRDGVETWPKLAKVQVASRLVTQIAKALNDPQTQHAGSKKERRNAG